MERINTPFTGEHFIATLRKWRELGSPYQYGTHGHKCTEDLLKRKKAQYPDHYTNSRMPKYHQNIAENAICRVSPASTFPAVKTPSAPTASARSRPTHGPTAAKACWSLTASPAR